MEEFVDALRSRQSYEGQITHEHVDPASEARFADCALDDRLASALADRGVDRLYAHQADAVRAIRAGDDVVLATETASGKSLAYTIPAVERALDRRATTLYVAPQVALIQDQATTLSDLADDLGFASGVSVDTYTGRLSRSEKEAVRERQPTILLTTPDMLHYGILPHANRLWRWFFERLETVVLDEVHAYRGVFGSHVALLCRRLARVVDRFSNGGDASDGDVTHATQAGDADGGATSAADPEWISCSATIGNPVEHVATLTGRDPDGITLVDYDDSASGPRHWLCWKPPTTGGGWGDGSRRRSRHVESMELFVELVARGHQTVVFAGSRQAAERYAEKSADRLRERGEGDLAARVGAYQAALQGDRRRELEADLRSGDLVGAWATSALELGVDLGGLDAVVLDGYPGTRMRTFQQAGRAGRGTDPSLVALVAGEDQLDQFVIDAPERIFDEPPERAITNPDNDRLRPDHVRSAARERWLSPGDDAHFGADFPDLVAAMTDDGRLDRRQTDDGVRWVDAGGGSPHHEMDLRSGGGQDVQLVVDGDTIATLGLADALRDAHPGAIYHHQGRSYEVVDLDLSTGVATLDRTWADYFTRVRHDKSVDVEVDRRATTFDARPDVPVRLADVTVHTTVTGYERRDAQSGERIGQRTLDLPETTLETEALYFTVPTDVERAMTEGVATDANRDRPLNPAADEGTDSLLADPGDFAGGIHAAEHAMISMFPFSFLCDRRDVGGLSTPHHDHTGAPTIFVYDGHPGGVGLVDAAVDEIDDLAATTRQMLASCGCADGCPACVQSPHCGNGNDPLDKDLATYLLAVLSGADP